MTDLARSGKTNSPSSGAFCDGFVGQGIGMKQTVSTVTQVVEVLQARRLVCGGYPEHTGEAPRPDATAWAVLALEAVGDPLGSVQAGRKRLAQWQLEDGRVCFHGDAPAAHWSTALAVLAWHGTEAQRHNEQLAVDFLLATAGHTLPRDPDSPAGHDTSLRGWTWVEGCHSWVEPTAWALLALRAFGRAEHPRVPEAIAMLLDRQLPSGGWNHGNTTVFGKYLAAIPLNTGLALSALAEMVPDDSVRNSLSFLEQHGTRTRAPLSLAWSLLALSVWGRRPAGAASAIEESLGTQQLYGAYGTSELAALLLASVTAEASPILNQRVRG